MLQWLGNVTTSVIEQGPGWMNLVSIGVNINPTIVFFGPLQTLVNGVGLKSLAASQAEKTLFANINVTTAASPLGLADADGYNSGNSLLGLSCDG